MCFKIGRCYKHTTGNVIKIVGAAHTTMYGWSLIAEESTNNGNLMPVGSDESYSVNWEEVPEEEFMEFYN